MTFKTMALMSADIKDCDRSRLDLYNGDSDDDADLISGESKTQSR